MKKAVREGEDAEGEVWGGGVPFPTGRGATPESLFHLKIVHSDALYYTKSKFLYVIKCKERYIYVITRYSRRLTVTQT